MKEGGRGDVAGLDDLGEKDDLSLRGKEKLSTTLAWRRRWMRRYLFSFREALVRRARHVEERDMRDARAEAVGGRRARAGRQRQGNESGGAGADASRSKQRNDFLKRKEARMAETGRRRDRRPSKWVASVNEGKSSRRRKRQRPEVKHEDNKRAATGPMELAGVGARARRASRHWERGRGRGRAALRGRAAGRRLGCTIQLATAGSYACRHDLHALERNGERAARCAGATSGGAGVAAEGSPRRRCDEEAEAERRRKWRGGQPGTKTSVDGEEAGERR